MHGNSKFMRILSQWVRSFVVVIIFMIPFRSSIADWNHVPSGSMKPTIMECERIFVNKLAYDLKVPLSTIHIAKWGDPGRGDVVTFKSPETGDRLVKRVVGVPGDIVEMVGNRLIINGDTCKYVYPAGLGIEYMTPEDRSIGAYVSEILGETCHYVMMIHSAASIKSFGPVAVPEGKYLMLGDNRDNSADSRYFGFVDRRQIYGKATHVVSSFDQEKLYIPRFGRWFGKIL